MVLPPSCDATTFGGPDHNLARRAHRDATAVNKTPHSGNPHGAAGTIGG